MLLPKVPALADVAAEPVRCTATITEPRGYLQREQCLFNANHLIPEREHCSKHMTPEDMLVAIPRLEAWETGLKALYAAVVAVPGMADDRDIRVEVTVR